MSTMATVAPSTSNRPAVSIPILPPPPKIRATWPSSRSLERGLFRAMLVGARSIPGRTVLFMLGTTIPELDLERLELTEFWRLGIMFAVEMWCLWFLLMVAVSLSWRERQSRLGVRGSSFSSKMCRTRMSFHAILISNRPIYGNDVSEALGKRFCTGVTPRCGSCSWLDPLPQIFYPMYGGFRHGRAFAATRDTAVNTFQAIAAVDAHTMSTVPSFIISRRGAHLPC
jgi:hypothetical protein